MIGSLEFVAGLLDLGDAVCGLRLHRVLENINTVEAQFLGFPEAIHEANAVLLPSRINHSQFHNAVMLTPNDMEHSRPWKGENTPDGA